MKTNVKNNVAVGRIRRLYRYPVKSMAGEELGRAAVGLNGFAHDRQFAFRRIADNSNFPWLTARRFPGLIRYRPIVDAGDGAMRVRTPGGQTLDIADETLRREIEAACGESIELVQNNRGIFDQAAVSIISLATLRRIEQQFGKSLDALRFRPNIIVETAANQLFEEQNWIGQTLRFDGATEIALTSPDQRCSMINCDPETAQIDPNVLKTLFKLTNNVAGVYGAPVCAGELKIGDQFYMSGEN